MNEEATNGETFRFPLRVYYEDTDAAGVVYYANYLKFMERARTEWLAALGFDLAEFEQSHGVLFVVARMEIEYRAPARLEFYTAAELTRIVTRSANLLKIEIDPNGALEIARRSRGTPRIVNRLLRRVRDFAEVRADGVITREVADDALAMLDVDASGLDVMDRKLLRTVLDKFAGGPVGVDNLAAAIGEERDTIEDVLEPFLIQQGFLQRTPRGRLATALAYRHFGLAPPREAVNPDLFAGGGAPP